MTFTSRIATAAATAAIILGAVVPSAFAYTSVNVIGNGGHSKTNVTVSSKNGSFVNQSNSSTIVTNVTSSSDTGDNKANSNTGGITTVFSGNANSNVKTTVGGSANTANVTTNCGCNTNSNIGVAGNGSYSTTTVNVSHSSWLAEFQQNMSEIVSSIYSNTETGDNTASGNTHGSVGVISGNGTSSVTVNITGSKNTLTQY